MATFNVWRIKHATTVTNQVDTINLACNPSRIEVRNKDDATPLYVRLDGQDPAVLGDDCDEVDAGQSIFVVSDDMSQVRVVAADAIPYSIRGLAE